VTKIIGCGGGVLTCRFKPLEALAVGVGMISRGEVALITATIGLQARLIDASLFSIVILVALITTLVTPLLLKLVYLIPGPASAAVPHRESEHTLKDSLHQVVEQIESLAYPEEALHVQEESHVP
jgi:hypothetical protein